MILLPVGTKRTFHRIVEQKHIAAFESGVVHEVCSTFQIAQDAEWVCRLLLLDMIEEEEEGIGTFVSVQHASPAGIGQEIHYTSELIQLEGNTVIAKWHAYIGERLVASGEQHQKILPKAKIHAIFGRLK